MHQIIPYSIAHFVERLFTLDQTHSLMLILMLCCSLIYKQYNLSPKLPTALASVNLERREYYEYHHFHSFIICYVLLYIF